MEVNVVNNQQIENTEIDSLIKPKIENETIDINSKTRRSKRVTKKTVKTAGKTNEKENKPKRMRISKKTIPKSLNEQTGHFYICNCMDNKKTNYIIPVLQEEDLRNLTSDTETSSETEKKLSNQYYCTVCGNGYCLKKKLDKHLQVHKAFCKICSKKFRCIKAYKNHLMKHIVEKYVCHYCEKEFFTKSTLLNHFDEHLKEQMFDTVLKLEDEYKDNNQDDFSQAYFNYNNSYYSKAMPSFETDEDVKENSKFSVIVNNYTDYFNYFIFPSENNSLAPTPNEPIFCYTCDIYLNNWYEVNHHMTTMHSAIF